jgi:hypothetical protein
MTRAPSRIDKYQIVRRLGSGGMGTVYLARDASLGREVAIKVLRGPVFDADDELLARFLQEARATAQLRHANIVTVYEVGQHDQQPFIVMEHVAGDSLATIIEQRRSLALATKLHYLEQICAGLHFAHRARIVHRDIKPANLMIDTEGIVRVLDFGIARLEGSGMTRDGDMIGTLNYMSPEQMLGRPVDHRSDIFAVGAVAYELIAYRQAFPGTIHDGLLNRLPFDPPEPLSGLCPGVDAELESLIVRALEKAPEARHPDLAHVQAALAACRRRIVQQRGATFEVAPASPTAGFSPTLQRPRPRTDAEAIRVELEEAERYLQAGDPISALNLAERVIQKAPSSVEAHAILVAAHGALAMAGASPNATRARFDTAPARFSRFPKWVLPAAGASVIAIVATGAGLSGVIGRGEPPRPEAPAAIEEATKTRDPGPELRPRDVPERADAERQNRIDHAPRDARPPDAPESGPAREDVKRSERRVPAPADVGSTREAAPDHRSRANGPSDAPPRDADTSARDTTAVPVATSPLIPSTARDLPGSVPPPPPLEAATNTRPAEPPPAAPVLTLLERERPGILSALDQYRNAYRTRSVEAMQDVFPTLPRERRQAYERAFKDRRGCPALDVQFGSADIFLGSDGQQANVTVMATYVCKAATAQADPEAPHADVFQLRKTSGRWQIVGMGALQQ